MAYKTHIGLEIHIQPKTKSKMFCRCKNEFAAAEPNKNICEICTGQPGVLPLPNEEAIKAIVQAGLALGSKITPKVHWDRKHYFYPDLPKGYQITQNTTPICVGGNLTIEYQDEGGKWQKKEIAINRLHLEEDAGKDIHPEGADYSLVDFNRAGTPLIELVTEPVIESKEEAAAFCKGLQKLFRHLGIADADMEKGQMRCEVNISLEKGGKWGTKVEVKNINSFKGVYKSIEFEEERQAEILEAGEKVKQETRGWNAVKQKTLSQRSKEEAHDYRYFPEPDIPLVDITEDYLSMVKKDMRELPQEKEKRFKEEYDLGRDMAEIITSDWQMAEFFEQAVSEAKGWLESEKGLKKGAEARVIKSLANYLVTELMRMVAEKGISFKELAIKPEDFAELMIIIERGEINSSAAQVVLKEMFAKGKDPSAIIEDRHLRISKDGDLVGKAVEEVLKAQPQAIADYKAGKDQALQFLMGQVMAKTKGQIDPNEAIKMIKKKIS